MRVGIPVADLTAGTVSAPSASSPRCWNATSVSPPRPVGPDLAAAGADLHARLPGRALADGEGRRQGAAGNEPSDLDPDRRVQETSDGSIAHRYDRRTDLGALRAGDDRRARASHQPLIYAILRRRARRTATLLNAATSSAPRTKSTETWVREFNEAGVPCATHLRDRPRCSRTPRSAPLHCAGRACSLMRGEPPHPPPRSASLGDAVPHAHQGKMVARPPEFGEQTDEVLAEFGFRSGRDRSAQKSQGGVIFLGPAAICDL